MVVLEVEDDARPADNDPDGATWFFTTPDDFEPHLTIYFTYRAGQIVLQAVHTDD